MMYFDENDNKRFNPNVLTFLANGENDKVISMLKNTDLSELVDCGGRTLLHYAAFHKNQFFMKLLIDKKVELNAIDAEGNTPIMLAIQCSDERFWGPLLQAGADLWKIKNDKGQCALWMIFENFSKFSFDFQFAMNETKKRCNSSADIAIALMSAGFQVYDLYIFKDLCIFNDAEITKEMLKQGCEVNLQDPKNENCTALHRAASMNDLDIVKVLLEFGADKNIENDLGRIPIYKLIYGPNTPNIEIIELLMPDSNDLINLDHLLINLSWFVRNLTSEIIHVILFHVVIYEARGSTISPEILNKIDANEILRNIFLKCKQELEETKMKIISGSISYFKMITYADHNISKFIKNDRVVEELSKIKGVDYFHRYMIKCFERALEISRLRKKAGQFICECIESLNGYDLVVDNILDFLNTKDFKLISTYAD